MIGIIIGILFLLTGYISFSIYCDTEKSGTAALSIVCFLLAIIAPWIDYTTVHTNDYYNHKVTVIAQNGQEYTYEECHVEIFKEKIIVDFEDEPSIIFYSPVKVEESEEDAD